MEITEKVVHNWKTHDRCYLLSENTVTPHERLQKAFWKKKKNSTWAFLELEITTWTTDDKVANGAAQPAVWSIFAPDHFEYLMMLITYTKYFWSIAQTSCLLFIEIINSRDTPTCLTNTLLERLIFVILFYKGGINTKIKEWMATSSLKYLILCHMTH